ncbi:MAG: 2-phospho-L-lactate guanylyltransferase [Dehalococcoidia bacterium]|nr:2-phospho-L-lactate guanylyltransferase [Dehalococcoidia bacterium]MCA9854961.1 2-phospho-L-lactate guanylyltransferase [Dehalococcoidia bacterium]
MSVPVLVPVSHLDKGKSRLADVLTPGQRSELALATLATVLDAVRDAGCLAIVLSADAAVRNAVPPPHAALDESPVHRGLNAQLTHAIDELGGAEVLILHGDLPLVTGAAIASLIRKAPQALSVTLVESGDGGTNAMLLRPPSVIELHYGTTSAALHRIAAEESGATLTAVTIPEIALDLDVPGDIDTLLASENGRTSAAGSLLRSWGFGANEADS